MFVYSLQLSVTFLFVCVVVQCFRHADLTSDRPSTIQFKEKLPWFLSALPSADCAKGGYGAYSTSVDLQGWFFHTVPSFFLYPFSVIDTLIVSIPKSVICPGYENGIIQASSFRTYHTPLNKQVLYYLIIT